MKDVKYKGLADAYGLTASDFERHGVTGQGAVTFDSDNDHTASVSDEAATYLTSDDGLGDVFEVVGESAPAEVAPEQDDTAKTSTPRGSRRVTDNPQA